MFEIFYFPIESDPGYFARAIILVSCPHCPPFPRGSDRDRLERNIPISNFVGNLIIGSERKISAGSSRKIEKRSVDLFELERIKK